MDHGKEINHRGHGIAERREPHDGAAHPNVVAHWKSIVNEKVPFGLRIED